MTLIKEYQRSGNKTTFVIRRRGYGSTMRMILQLFNEAAGDFPDVGQDDINLVHYSGQRYSGTFGVEFTLRTTDVPDGYEEIKQLESTF